MSTALFGGFLILNYVYTFFQDSGARIKDQGFRIQEQGKKNIDSIAGYLHQVLSGGTERKLRKGERQNGSS